MEYKHPSLLYTGCLVVFSFFFFFWGDLLGYMGKFLLFICVYISVGSFAQSIRTKFTEGIRLTDFVGSTIHAFYSGESVTIHAYKKKSGIYHFLIETDNYATFLKCKNIP